MSLLGKYVRKAINKRRLFQQRNAIINSKHNVLEIGNVYDARKFGFSLSDSVLYNFPKNDYREYINTWEAYQPRLCDTKFFAVSDDKLLFSNVMKNFVDKPEVYALVNDGKVQSVCEQDITNNNLYDFFINNGGGVVKARGGFNGYGINVFVSNGDSLVKNDKIVSKTDFDTFICRVTDAMVQKRMVQGEFENKFFDKAINTVRIVSIKKKDASEHEIVAALQRIGTNKTDGVDNFAQGGLSALIDVETGVLSKATSMTAVNELGDREFFSTHPDTGAQIEGTVIPNWEDVKNKIVDITRRLPLFSYIAWDIVIKDNGIAVIETNMKSSLDIFQIHGGMRNQLLGRKYAEHGYLVDEDLMKRGKVK